MHKQTQEQAQQQDQEQEHELVLDQDQYQEKEQEQQQLLFSSSDYDPKLVMEVPCHLLFILSLLFGVLIEAKKRKREEEQFKTCISGFCLPKV